jgi:hypothetical protein
VNVFFAQIRKGCSLSAAAIAMLLFSMCPGASQTIPRAKVQIVAGPTILVSRAEAALPHYENLAAGDPMHTGRLITCSHIASTEARKLFDQRCYASFDDGLTWQPTLTVSEGAVNGDPTVAYGLGNDVYVVALVLRNPEGIEPPDPDAPPRHDTNTVVFKSTDGGHTWHEASRFAFIDREFVDVDTTHGKYAGRVYVAGQSALPTISGPGGRYALDLWRSLDGGKTFLGPIQAAYPQSSVLFGVGTAAVLSDGTYIVIFGLTKPGKDQNLPYGYNPNPEPNTELYAITSRDGGETFDKSVKIADIALDRARSEGGILNQLAADPGSKAFKDRVYAVFPAIVDDRIQIEFSYSADKGKTWSKPAVINDDRSPEKGGQGPDHLLPSVAVNKDGVVLITWYDRREAKDNLGWRLRAAASLDGGETFSASVPVTDAIDAYPRTTPLDIGGFGNTDRDHALVSLGFYVDPFFVAGGHTSGLAVDSNGTFYPTWIDNHAGVSQLWTAAVRVQGAVVKHGAPDLAPLDDVSKSVAVELARPKFDATAGTLTVTAQIKNTSKNAIQTPVKVRVVALGSGLGIPEIVNSDNAETGTGAVWDFSAQIVGGKLGSLQRSAPKTLIFRLSEMRALNQGQDFSGAVFNLDARVYGKVEEKKKK